MYCFLNIIKFQLLQRMQRDLSKFSCLFQNQRFQLFLQLFVPQQHVLHK